MNLKSFTQTVATKRVKLLAAEIIWSGYRISLTKLFACVEYNVEIIIVHTT